jgi:hypothetical protein
VGCSYALGISRRERDGVLDYAIDGLELNFVWLLDIDRYPVDLYRHA